MLCSSENKAYIAQTDNDPLLIHKKESTETIIKTATEQTKTEWSVCHAILTIENTVKEENPPYVDHNFALQNISYLIIVKSMQRPGTETIRTRIQQREIYKITNSQYTKRTYGQPSKHLFPKRWPLSNQNRTKNNMNTRKVKRHRNPDTKTCNREPQQTTASERSVIKNWVGLN